MFLVSLSADVSVAPARRSMRSDWLSLRLMSSGELTSHDVVCGETTPSGRDTKPHSSNSLPGIFSDDKINNRSSTVLDLFSSFHRFLSFTDMLQHFIRSQATVYS